MTHSTNPAAVRAIQLLDGITKAAARLNPYRQPGAPELTPAAVCNWNKRGIPICYCIPIEKETNGEILCEEMRPDLDWAYLRGSKPSPDRPHKALRREKQYAGRAGAR